MKTLISKYKGKKSEIKNRLQEFKKVGTGCDEDLFAELCFCLLTPQSKAVSCDRAIKDLKKKGLLVKGSPERIANCIKGYARFHNKKSEYLVNAREIFTADRKINLKRRLDGKDALKTREWLIENIKGLGYKEASHFLRNIGLGQDMAILDTHILKNLKRMGAIDEIPRSMSKKNYVELEEKMRQFARKVGIPLEELDLLFWSNETGFVFK
ncbi:MAG: N-glycosylase/DNA lyase [Candidatus Omnitrophota bacterium]